MSWFSNISDFFNPPDHGVDTDICNGYVDPEREADVDAFNMLVQEVVHEANLKEHIGLDTDLFDGFIDHNDSRDVDLFNRVMHDASLLY